jgi:hypothetical protein
MLALMVIGLAALARLIGDRLGVWRQAPMSPLRRLAIGSATLELASLTPVLGWFILLPLCALAGLGAVVMAIFQRKAIAPSTWAPTA